MAAASMATAYALVLLLLFGTLGCCLHAAEVTDEPKDVVASVCATGTSDFCHIHLTTKFCVSTLRSDNRSARAQDARDLALVAIDLARRGAEAVDAKVAAFLERPSSEDAARLLRHCRSDYAAVARLAAMCRGMVQTYRPSGDYKPKYYNAECAQKLVRKATDCGHLGRYVEELDDALRWELINVARRTALFKAMIEAMVGVKDPVGFRDEFDDVHY